MNEITMNKLESRYMNEVKKHLPFKISNRKKILTTIQKGMQDYVHDYQITDYHSLVAGFGTPQEIVDYYVDVSPSKMRLQRIRFTIAFLVISLLLMCSITIGIAYYYRTNTPEYIIEEVPIELETFPNE